MFSGKGSGLIRSGIATALAGLGLGNVLEEGAQVLGANGQEGAANALADRAATVKAQNALAFLNTKNPGGIRADVWENFLMYAVYDQYPYTEYTVEFTEIFDTLVFPADALTPFPWTPLQRDRIAPGLNNFTTKTIPNDAVYLVDSIKAYFPNVAYTIPTTGDPFVGSIDPTVQRQEQRTAFIQWALDALEYELRDGQTTVQRGRVAHLTDDYSGSNVQAAAHAITTTVAASNFERGIVALRNGPGRSTPLIQPLILAPNRMPQIEIKAPRNITYPSGAPVVGLRIGFNVRIFRPGGTLRT